MLTSKWIFKFFFFTTAIVALWMGISFSTKYILHKKFSEYSKGEALHWGILSKSSEKHYLYVDYSFQIRGDRYSSQYVFQRPIFKSREAAEIGLEGKKSSVVDVWFFGKDRPVSILENFFPYNELIRFLVATAILVYFSFLKNYLGQFSRSEPVQF